jgi:hypothetical protein
MQPWLWRDPGFRVCDVPLPECPRFFVTGNSERGLSCASACDDVLIPLRSSGVLICTGSSVAVFAESFCESHGYVVLLFGSLVMLIWSANCLAASSAVSGCELERSHRSHSHHAWRDRSVNRNLCLVGDGVLTTESDI